MRSLAQKGKERTGGDARSSDPTSVITHINACLQIPAGSRRAQRTHASLTKTQKKKDMQKGRRQKATRETRKRGTRRADFRDMKIGMMKGTRL